MSILESSRHKLRIDHGLNLVTHSLREWEAFPTPGALTHIRITWDLSPTMPEVSGVTGVPLMPMVFWPPHGDVHDTMKDDIHRVVVSELKLGPTD